MKLRPVTPARPGDAQRIPCVACGRWHAVEQTLADLDGPAFQAYFGEDCAMHRLDNEGDARLVQDSPTRRLYRHDGWSYEFHRKPEEYRARWFLAGAFETDFDTGSCTF